MQRSGVNYFYHQDGLGTVTELTDSTGATAQSYAYDAYGNIVQQTGSVDNPYTYTGRELDQETGLYYYRARYYDPRTGRFLQKDPKGFSGGDINLYPYVGNSPTSSIDPTGSKIVLLPGKCGSSLPNFAVMEKLECMDKCNGSLNIFVTSGWRTAAQNKCAKGKRSSYHLSGQAADITIPGYSPSQVAALASACGFTGIGTYDANKDKSAYTHVDVRPQVQYMQNGEPATSTPNWRWKEPRCQCASAQ